MVLLSTHGKALCVALLLSACDGDLNDGANGTATASDLPRNCGEETRDDTYSAGMVKPGEAFAVRILDAIPAPPDRGDNTWIVAVEDAAGNPMADASIEVDPFMPDHNHGTSIRAHVTALEEPGQFQIEPVNLFMPGLWEVRLDVSSPAIAAERIVFRFCVDP